MGLVTVLTYMAVLALGVLLGAGATYFIGIVALRYKQYIIDNLKVDVKDWRNEWRSSQATLMNVLERSRQLEPETEAWGTFVMDAVDDDDGAALERDRHDRSGSISLD
jgi:hypothetical protein